MRGATGSACKKGLGHRISIHAPHAGCDFDSLESALGTGGISIHAPHAGCDRPQAARAIRPLPFQSTHPMRGATTRRDCSPASYLPFQSTHPMRGATERNFNPRTPCGVRPADRAPPWPLGAISIHAPHAGCDVNVLSPATNEEDFNPRTPCGVRRAESGVENATGKISIHAPHAGCDLPQKVPGGKRAISIHAPHAGCDYYPAINKATIYAFQSTHPMRGATLFFKFVYLSSGLFQSTHPMRGATYNKFVNTEILIHFNPRTPCGVRRCGSENNDLRKHHFNPRTPCGVRRAEEKYFQPVIEISIHAPHAGCDRIESVCHSQKLYFNPRTPCGVRPEKFFSSFDSGLFQSTHPMRGATNSASRIA